MMIWSGVRPQSSASAVDSSAEIAMQSSMISSEEPAEISLGVLLHLRHDELLVQRAAVDADANRLAVIRGDAADRRELLVPPVTRADVARVDPVLVERRGALGEPRQQEMAIVVKVADERRRAAGVPASGA